MAQDTSVAPAEPDFTTGFWTRGTLLGDAGGVRSGLWNYGITFGLQDINEVWGNVSGGVHRGASYNGATLMSVGLDTQRAFGWEGGTFNVSGWNIRGRNIATDNLLNLQTPSGILASNTTRLWEVWFQQSFLDGRFDVKIGQQSLDLEFMTSQGAGLFLNSAMGWPDAAGGRSLCRRAGLSAVVARRAPARTGWPRLHRAARRIRRQSSGWSVRR